MAFIHKNINSALLMLIVFISTALVTATVYSVEAFDTINEAYADRTMQAENLAKELAEKEAYAATLQQTAQLNQEREKALAEFIEKQRQDTVGQDTQTTTVTPEPQVQKTPAKQPYNPYRQKYWGWVPRKIYSVY
jgi:hypothetical protein